MHNYHHGVLIWVAEENSHVTLRLPERAVSGNPRVLDFA